MHTHEHDESGEDAREVHADPIRPRFSLDDVRQILQEYRAADVTQPIAVDKLAAFHDELRALRPHAIRVQVVSMVIGLAVGIAAIVGGVIGVQSWVEHAILREVAPIRLDVSNIRQDVREILRRTPVPPPAER